LKGFYNNPNPNPKIEIKNNITIGFHSNQLCERGVSVAVYDYAYYNQKIYGNKSIIFYCKHYNSDTNVIRKFEKEFKCYAYDTFSDIDKIILDEKIDYFYNIKSGSKSDNQLVTKCPNLIHAVFTVEPHGEKYAAISKQLSSKYNNIVDYVPHMINLPECNENMREQINIPNNAIVLGRIGGFYQFDIQIAHNAIKNILDIDSNIFFLFVNTNIFYEHPQIIYLDKIIDPIEKVKFINTCDAMIHARSDGETFGLAIAEFSSLNKPVITSVSNIDNSHIEILGSNGIIYDTEESLIEIFKNIRTIIKSKNDWNAYKEYTPEKVMKKFMDVFELNIYTKEILFDKLLITCYKNDDLANSSICKNEKWEPHIMEFLNFYKTFYKITSIVDIGANIGYHTLYFSDIVDENCGIVYAFEPQPQNYNLLIKNIKNNNKNNVIIYNLACSDCECESKIAQVSLDSQNTNMGDFTLNHNIMSDNFYKVKCVRLDDILKDTIDIIKIDVQGWEQNVLNGSQNIISNYKPLLIIEIEEYQLNRNGITSGKLITQIRNFGYYIYYLDYKYPSDHICVHETKLQEFNTHFKKYIFEHNELNNINNNILYGINKKIKCVL
jgi:FkbM family methyltransferase